MLSARGAGNAFKEISPHPSDRFAEFVVKKKVSKDHSTLGVKSPEIPTWQALFNLVLCRERSSTFHDSEAH
jgi:hypothetical protein